MKGISTHRVRLRDGRANENGDGTLFMKDEAEVYQKQVSFRRKYANTLRPEQA